MGKVQYFRRVEVQLEFYSGGRMVDVTMGKYNVQGCFIENRDLPNDGLGICTGIDHETLFFADEVKIAIGEQGSYNNPFYHVSIKVSIFLDMIKVGDRWNGHGFLQSPFSATGLSRESALSWFDPGGDHFAGR
jgi:hypothetical protein